MLVISTLRAAVAVWRKCDTLPSVHCTSRRGISERFRGSPLTGSNLVEDRDTEGRIEASRDLLGRGDRIRGVRARLAIALLGMLALSVPASAPAKGFARVVLVASDGRSVEVRANESEIDGLLSRRSSVERIRGRYLRLFFVGPGDFPANPARYYPDLRCVALDWPTYETTCRRVNPAVVRLLRRAHTLSRFRVRPTVLARVTYLGTFPGLLKTAAALKGPVELALDRTGRTAPQPRRCYALTGRWRGPAAALRPRRFLVCADGVYADRRLYPLRRGVWEWFQLNVGPPSAARAPAGTRSATHTTAGLTVTLPSGWRVVHRRLTPCVNPIERLTVTGRGALVMLQESLDSRRYIRRFSPRPRRFELGGKPEAIACCAPTRRPGWFFNFRDRGRGFYVYVYVGQIGTRAEALAMLDRLQVQPRRL